MNCFGKKILYVFYFVVFFLKIHKNSFLTRRNLWCKILRLGIPGIWGRFGTSCSLSPSIFLSLRYGGNTSLSTISLLLYPSLTYLNPCIQSDHPKLVGGGGGVDGGVPMAYVDYEKW